MTGFQRIASVFGGFVFGCCASVALWTFWIPRCADDCGRAGVGFVVLLAVFPPLCAGLALILQAVRWRGGVKVGVAIVAVAIAAGAAIYLGDGAGGGTNAAGLR